MLRRYDRGWLPTDAMAGLTIWALMVPQAMAYAGIAGVPVQNSLYVMPLAVVGYALFGSSRHLFVGPSATVATLSASSVAVVASASTGSAEYVALTCALTLMVGVIYVAGGLARMGFVARFFARPVLEGADLSQDDLLARVRAAEPPPRTVVVDFEAVGQVDVTGAQTLRSVHDTLDALGIRLIVARAKSTVRHALRRNGIVDVLGEDNLAPSVGRAVEAAQPGTTSAR